MTGEEFLAAEERIGLAGADHDYRRIFGPVTNLNIIISGAYAHKASTGALYRAHVGIITDAANARDDRVLCAFCTYGSEGRGDDTVNVRYSGTDLKEALKKVNAQMRSKMRASRGPSRYLTDSGDPDDALLTEEVFRRAFLSRDPAFGGTPAAT
jgi:hypothetical protein